MTEVEKAKKIAEVSKKLDSAKRELKTKRGYLDGDINFNRDMTLSANEVKYAAKKVESLQKELDRLK